MEPVISSKRKHSRTLPTKTDYSKCLICQSGADTHEPLSKLTSRGFSTFKDAVETRRDNVHDRLWNDLQNAEEFLANKPQCHRDCPSEYTHKKSLEEKRLRTETGETSSTSNRTNRKGGINFKSVCFLCEKERDGKGERSLIYVTTIDRQRSIHEKAKELNDEAMLVKIVGHGDKCIDLIANDFRYHIRCMNRYMTTRGKHKGDTSNKFKEYDTSFSELVSEISDGLLNDKHAYSIGQLLKRYNELLSGLPTAAKGAYRADRLMKRLLKHFGDDIQFVNIKDTERLVCASTLTVKELCDQVVCLQVELDECQVYSEEDDTNCELIKNISSSSFPLAKHLRTEIKAIAKKVQSAENDEVEISYDEASSQVPVDLYNHLAWLITENDEHISEDGKVKLSVEDNKNVLNLAQDIMGFLSKHPIPKHIGVALHVLKETRSKNLINRFGNCVSYATVQRYLTTIANEVAEREEREGIFIPSNIVQGQFTQYALDNLNFHSETEDGGSLDATTNIIYQYTSDVENTSAAGNVPLSKTRQLTIAESAINRFKPVSSSLTSRDRKDARSLRGVEINCEVGNDTLADENIVWFLLRMFPTQMMTSEDDSICSSLTWNAFFELLSGQQAPKTKIGYGPMYPQTPTNPDVVQTSLDYFISLNLKLGQSKTVVTCDQAIYDIIKGLVKKNPVRYKDVIVRLGGFHIAQNFLGSIGFFMKESGIEEMLVESNICGRGTANKVMAGKDYYKKVRYHSWICEALFMLKWEAFEQWLLWENEVELLSSLSSLLERLRTAFKNRDKDRVVELVGEVLPHLRSLESHWVVFEGTLGVTARLWGMYIEMVLILKRYIHAERAGLWDQHLQETRNILPYTTSSGHNKYMSCLPIYLNEMKNLPNTTPDVHREFEAGNFAVHQVGGDFNGVWTDMALEQTYNKEGKTSLFKGITQTETAREKYIKTLPFLTEISESVKQMVHMDSTHPDHHEKLSKNYMAKVLKIRDTIREKMRNPFADTLAADKLVNIATGETLVSTDLVEAKRLGLEAMTTAEVADNEKIITPKIITFATQQKQRKKKQDTVKQLISEECSVTRALCFTQELSNEARIETFSYEWSAYPPSLFEPDKTAGGGFTMRKGTKSDFIETLQNKVTASWEPVKELPTSESSPVYVIDAMAFVQRFQTLGANVFCQLQERYKNKILSMKPENCSEVHFVGDRYDFGPMSLKSDERQRRETGAGSPEFIPDHNMKIPGWKAFLSNPQNKANLLSYLACCWSQSSSSLPEGFTLVVGVDTKGICLTKAGNTVIEDLCCQNHEEADTRVIAHIANCQERSIFVIQATDTDIIMLAMYYFPRLPHITKLWVEKNDGFLPIHGLVIELAKVVEKDSVELMDTLLTAYVMTGCVSVSYPFGRGKKRAAKIALGHVGTMPALTNFSHENVSLDDQLYDEARDFLCNLYGKPGYSSLDRLRAHLFASSKSDLRSLPPTEDAFHFHILRSLCQISLYKQAHLRNPTLLPPEEYGRFLDNDRLIPVMKKKTVNLQLQSWCTANAGSAALRTVHVPGLEQHASLHASAMGTHINVGDWL